MGNTIFPKALERAAKAFADRPKMLGEILVALCTDARKMKFSELQEYIIAECMEEINTRLAARAGAAERKRKQRKGE